MNLILFHLITLVPGLVILFYLMRIHHEAGAAPELIRERNLMVNIFYGWVLAFGLFAALNPRDLYTTWGRIVVPLLCLIFIALSFRQVESPDMVVLRLFGKRWRFHDEGWYLLLWFMGETIQPIAGGDQRSSTILRDEYLAAKARGDRNAREPNLKEDLSSSWVPSRAAFVAGQMVNVAGGASGSPLRIHVDPTWFVVDPITYANLGEPFLRERVGGFKNPIDVISARLIPTMEYEQVKGLAGKGDLLLFSNIDTMCTEMRAAADGPNPDARQAWINFQTAHPEFDINTQDIHFPHNQALRRAVAAKSRAEIIQLVGRDHPGTLQATYVQRYGIYMALPLEQVEEDPDVIKARSEFQQATIDVGKLEAEAAGEAAKIGGKALRAVEAARGPRPHAALQYEALSDRQKFERDSWDAALAEAMTALLKAQVYGSTKSTVFAETASPIRSVVNIDPNN